MAMLRDRDGEGAGKDKAARAAVEDKAARAAGKDKAARAAVDARPHTGHSRVSEKYNFFHNMKI
jgi:hypothetical protein